MPAGMQPRVWLVQASWGRVQQARSPGKSGWEHTHRKQAAVSVPHQPVCTAALPFRHQCPCCSSFSPGNRQEQCGQRGKQRCASPASMRNSVDFPAPFSPTIDSRSPRPSVNVRPSMSMRSPSWDFASFSTMSSASLGLFSVATAPGRTDVACRGPARAAQEKGLRAPCRPVPSDA